MEIIRNGSLPEAASLIPETDTAAFSVLKSILTHTCEFITSDGRDFMMCSSVSRYPLWIWTRDGKEAEAAPVIADILRSEFPEVHEFNMKEPLRGELEKLEPDKNYSTVVSMLAYDCPQPIPPHHSPAGRIRMAEQTDIDEIVKMDHGFFLGNPHQQLPSEEIMRETEREHIAAGHTYLWIDDEGHVSAKCYYEAEDGIARISGVYTNEHARRKGFAEQVVYKATCDAIAEGNRCCLYTDAEYPASNACYIGIGYVLRANLVTVRRA